MKHACLSIINHGDLACALPVIVVRFDERHSDHDGCAEQDGHQVSQEHGVVLHAHSGVIDNPNFMSPPNFGWIGSGFLSVLTVRLDERPNRPRGGAQQGGHQVTQKQRVSCKLLHNGHSKSPSSAQKHELAVVTL